MEFLLVNLLGTLILTFFGVISLLVKEGKTKQFFFCIFFIIIFIFLSFIKIYSTPYFFLFRAEEMNFIISFIVTGITAIISAYICMRADLDGFIFKNSIKVFAVLINVLLVFMRQMTYLPFLNDTGKLIIKAIFDFIVRN